MAAAGMANDYLDDVLYDGYGERKKRGAVRQVIIPGPTLITDD